MKLTLFAAGSAALLISEVAGAPPEDGKRPVIVTETRTSYCIRYVKLPPGTNYCIRTITLDTSTNFTVRVITKPK